MPRNSAGTFALVAGNPVVNATTISASWANDTLNDLAAELTDSLSRSGKGGMLVPMEFADGTVGDPAITFSAAPTTGLYRAGTNDVRFSLAGVDLVQLSATLIKFIARVTDGASAVGVEIGTTNALANAGAKLLRVLNATVEKFYIDKDGSMVAGGSVTGVGIPGTGDNDGSPGLIGTGAAGSGMGAGGPGVLATGHVSGGPGLRAVGGGTNGVGIEVVGGSSNAFAIVATGTGSGCAIQCTAGSASAPIQLMPCPTPSSLEDGQIWVESGTNTLKVRINGVTKTVTLT